MIILLTRSSQSAKSTAEYLRKASTQGWFVFYFSNDFRAMKQATSLARKKAIVVNTVLRISSLLGFFGSVALQTFLKSSAIDNQAGSLFFYVGVTAGICLIGLESLR